VTSLLCLRWKFQVINYKSALEP